MTTVNARFGIAMTAEQYAGEWRQSASKFAASGDYIWMAEQLGSAQKVLEVGCGSGESTLALMTAHRQVLVVEVNEHCATMAEERLSAAGIDVERLSLQQLASLTHWTTPGVKLLVADLLAPELESLIPPGWLDAVVCWLSGSTPGHIGETIGKSHADFDGSEMAEFRLAVQRRCYDLGQSLLAKQGLVHVVDRLVIGSWAGKDWAREELTSMMAKVAGSSYQVTKSGVFLRKLTGLDQSKIQYVGPVEATRGQPVMASSLARRT